jgi:hypothetical protein
MNYGLCFQTGQSLYIREQRSKQLWINVTIVLMKATFGGIAQEHKVQERASFSACHKKTCHETLWSSSW